MTSERNMTQPRQDAGDNEELHRVSEEVVDRLGRIGVWLSGDERPEDLVRILEAVERFEVAVRTRGGDLMVDEGPEGRTTEPDDVHFTLPHRHADESAERFVDRVERARAEVMRHPAVE
jgi:hypothetical protein